ncbi:MAG: DUF4040 domain-containing protein [Treponema sp.]|nr:DUF4040 domain-containing protein [Treponema sp.]
MTIFEIILLLGLVVCALAVSLTKKLVSAIVVFMSYSVIMSILWLLLESPDLALTEAAVGAGITSILLFLAMRRINLMGRQQDELTLQPIISCNLYQGSVFEACSATVIKISSSFFK